MAELDEIIKLYKVLEDSQKTLLRNAERLMGNLAIYANEFGECGKSPQLDFLAWQKAINNDPDLYTVWSHFMQAEKLLCEAQKPFMKREFFIK